MADDEREDEINLVNILNDMENGTYDTNESQTNSPDAQGMDKNSNVGRAGTSGSQGIRGGQRAGANTNTNRSNAVNKGGNVGANKSMGRAGIPSNAGAKRFSDAKDSVFARKKLAQKRKEYKKPNPSYAKNKLNPADVKRARAAKSLGTRLSASRLEPKAKLFEASQKQMKNRLKSRTASAQPKPTLDLIDRMENEQRIRANKMKVDVKKIKAQEAIEKAGPYGKLVSLFIGCKSWCLGESAIMLVAFVGGVLGILELTGVI